MPQLPILSHYQGFPEVVPSLFFSETIEVTTVSNAVTSSAPSPVFTQLIAALCVQEAYAVKELRSLKSTLCLPAIEAVVSPDV